MKKIIIILITLHTSLFTLHLTAQPCLPDGIYFTSQAQIDSFQINYPGCTEIEGDVRIEGNDITNLNGLSVLTSIGGYLYIGRWYPQCNPVLTSLTGLDNVISIGGDIRIWSNEALTSLSGLGNVTFIGGDLWIRHNYALTSLTGLDNVTSIWRSLLIESNFTLTSLTGLDNVTSIGGDLWIIGSGALSSLTGLDNIDAASIDGLRIYYNNSLSTCEVQSICDYLASPGGDISIYANKTGCNSQIQVEEACATVTVEEINLAENISIYPNPAKDILTVSCTNGAKIEEIAIYNQMGQKVLEGEFVNNTIDVSRLHPGMYIVELINQRWKVRRKLIVE